MKQQFLLIILLISLTLFQSVYTRGRGRGRDGEDGEDGELGQCSLNPLLPKLKEWTKDLERELSEEDKRKLKDALKGYERFDGELGENLEKCGSFEGESTCCTHKLLRVFPKLVKGFIKSKIRGEKGKPIHKLLLESIIKGSGKCLGREFAQEIRDGEEFQNIVREYGKCERKQLHGQARFMAGMMCGLCFGPESLSTAFDYQGDQPRLIVSASNYDEYDGEIQENFGCINKVNKKLYKFIKKLINQIPDTPRCQEFGKRLKAVADGEELTQAPPSNCRGKAKAFGGGCSDLLDGENDRFKDLDPEDIKGGKRPKGGKNQENSERPEQQQNNNNNSERPDDNQNNNNNERPNNNQNNVDNNNRGGRNNSQNRRRRVLNDNESTDFVFSDSPDAFSVYASVDEVGTAEDLLGDENVELVVEDDDLEEQIQDSVDDFYEEDVSDSINNLYSQVLKLSVLLFVGVLHVIL